MLELISTRPNICKSLHLPAQSGNNRILSLMRRNYTREAYLALVEKVKTICGNDVALSSDFICGFCGETDDEFEETMDLVRRVRYTTAFIFPYSTREVTLSQAMPITIYLQLLRFRKQLRIDVTKTTYP